MRVHISTKWSDLNITITTTTLTNTTIPTTTRYNKERGGKRKSRFTEQEKNMVPTTLQNSFSMTFPWLSRTKRIVFPDYSVHAKDQCQFSITSNHTRNKSRGTTSKVDIEIICEWSKQKKILNHCTQSAYNSLNFFSAFLLTFVPWYIDFPWLSLTLWVFPDFGLSNSLTFSDLLIFPWLPLTIGIMGKVIAGVAACAVGAMTSSQACGIIQQHIDS